MALLLAVGEAVEEHAGDLVGVQRFPEVGGHADLARLVSSSSIDVDVIAGGDPGALPDLDADADEEPAPHRRHAAAIRVAVDRDADLLLLPKSAPSPRRRAPRCRRRAAVELIVAWNFTASPLVGVPTRVQGVECRVRSIVRPLRNSFT